CLHLFDLETTEADRVGDNLSGCLTLFRDGDKQLVEVRVLRGPRSHFRDPGTEANSILSIPLNAYRLFTCCHHLSGSIQKFKSYICIRNARTVVTYGRFQLEETFFVAIIKGRFHPEITQ